VLTPIGVVARNTYVLAIYAPGSRSKIRRSYESRRPWLPPEIGAVLTVGRERLRVTSIDASVARSGSEIVHRLDVMTAMARMKRRGRPRPRRRAKILRMPASDGSVVADFLRCHVLVRVFGGDPEAWLEALRNGTADEMSGADVRFVRWVRARLRYDPMLIAAIRRMVDSTPLWKQASRINDAP